MLKIKEIYGKATRTVTTINSIKEEAKEKPRGLEQKWRILITVMFGLFMIILDSTIVNIAFPTLRSEFGCSSSERDGSYGHWLLNPLKSLRHILSPHHAERIAYL